MPRYLVVFEQVEYEIEAEDEDWATREAYDLISQNKHYIERVEEIDGE